MNTALILSLMNLNIWKFNIFRLLKLFNRLDNELVYLVCVPRIKLQLSSSGGYCALRSVQHRDRVITCTEHYVLLTSKYTHSDLQVKMSGMLILLRISDGYIWITGLAVPMCFLSNWRKILYILTKVEVLTFCWSRISVYLSQ